MTVKLYQLLGGVAALAVGALAWLLLAPPGLGGGTSYAIARGSSMAPQFRTGDLVVTRAASSYKPGEIAAYRNHDFNRVVLHRIVRRDGNRFAFKGDDNTYVDSARVTQADIVGRLWFSVPGVGRLGDWKRALLAAPALVLLLLFAAVRRRALRPGGLRRGGTMVFATAAGMSALVLVSTLILPTTGGVAGHRYEQRGTFGYHAVPAAAAAVYPSGRVRSGDPIFVRLVRDLRIALSYRFSSALPHAVDGSTRLRAVLQSAGGWKRTIELQSPTPFRGDVTVAAGTLHLDRLRALIARFQSATGVIDDTYTLTIQPTVAVRGTVGSEPLRERFAPPLQFHLDPLELRVVPPQVLGDGPAPDPFVSTRAGIMPAAAAPARIAPLGWTIARLRAWSLLAGALALLGALLCGLPTLRSRLRREGTEDEAARLFGDRVIRVSTTRFAVRDARMVEVRGAASLVHLADELERPILHDVDSDAYLVEGDMFVYRHAPNTAAARLSAPPVSDAAA
jgi:signal peptidase I